MAWHAGLPYQDPLLAPEQRVDDLISRMGLEDKAGLLFQPVAKVGPLDEDGWWGTPSMADVLARRICHMNVHEFDDIRTYVQWHNAVQLVAAQHPLAIPVTVSTDPRHHFSDNPASSFAAGPFSQWPEMLGLAAVGSTELVQSFGEIVRREYVALGIRTALHPQLDVTTEPRWGRQSGTFGEDAALASRLGVAYTLALQGPQIGPTSVSVMAKHFPGGGPVRDGEDPHFSWGREQVYPGGNTEYHLLPFKAVVDAGVSQLMPSYAIPIGTTFDEIAFAFNASVISELLRDEWGFDGVVCTDWNVLTERPWGVEHLSVSERIAMALEAGVDQFGGNWHTDEVIALVRGGTVTEQRLDLSVRRILRAKFRLGLFDSPYIDVDTAITTVGDPAAIAAGLAAQSAACTLLTNHATVTTVPTLPLRRGMKIYAEGVEPAALEGFATIVTSPDEADVAVIRLLAPWKPRGEPGTLEDAFHSGTLEFPAEDLERIRGIAAAVPTIIDIYLDRPAVLTGLTDTASAIMVNFGATDEALVRVLFGEVSPQGRLPFDLPRSDAAIEASRADTPFDTAQPLFRCGFGLAYDS